jgi:hypothetical protein
MENTVQPQMQNNNPVAQPLQSPPKSSPLLMGLIILVIISFGAIGYLFWQNQQLEKQLLNHASAQSVNPETIQTTVIPTRIDQHKDWLVYSDVKNGYQVSYPPTWKRVNSFPQSIEFTIESPHKELIHSDPFNYVLTQNKNTDTSHLFVLNNKSVLFTYVACDGEGCGVGTQDLTTFSQILSTFKFTTQFQTDSSNWKTYANSQYGFLFKYPNDGVIKNSNFTGYISSITLLDPDITLYIGTKDESVSHENPIPVKIDGLDAIRFSLPMGQNPAQELIYFHKNGIYYSFQFIWDGKDQNMLEKFDQILSTFKFTNQTQTGISNWQSYSNTTIGFMIKYPPDWRKVGNETSTEMIGFGPASVGEDVQWGINIYTNMTIDGIVSEMGKQFSSSRKEQRNDVVVDGIKGIEAVVTTSTEPTWIYRQVIFPLNGKLIAISNGAVEDNKFNDFYKTFKVINK